MVVGTLEAHLRLDGCSSLKEKRQVIRSVMDRARRDYQVAAAEVSDLNLWNVATLGFACVSNDPRHAESVIQRLVDFLDSSPEVVVESVIRERVRV